EADSPDGSERCGNLAAAVRPDQVEHRLLALTAHHEVDLRIVLEQVVCQVRRMRPSRDGEAPRVRTFGEPGEAHRLVPVEREDGDSEEIGSLRLDEPGDPAPGPGAGVHQPRVMAFLPEDGDDGTQAQGREAG